MPTVYWPMQKVERLANALICVERDIENGLSLSAEVSALVT
jgi:hypothetical protein